MDLKLYEEILSIIKTKSNVILRHDVDVSLEDAHYMAFIEYLNGVKAKYYIRFDCDYYNPYTKQNKQRLNQINSYGHETGLHIEVNNEEDLKKIGGLKSFTFHINNEFTKTLTEEYYYGVRNDSLIKGGYVSDSRGEFNEEKLQYIKDNDNFTLVIHPEWWLNAGTKEERITHTLNKIKEQAIKEICPKG